MIGFGLALAGIDVKRDYEVAERKRLRAIWGAILQRCNNPKSQAYQIYGGRGIKCLLRSYEEFVDDVGYRPSPAHSLDRIDVNGHYAVGNLRWATQSEQMSNVRTNAFVQIDGKSYKRLDLAREYGVTSDQIDYRTKKGLPFELVISKNPLWDTSSLPLAVAAAALKRRQRKQCKRGHDLTGPNVYEQKGRRHCRACRKQWRPS